MEKEKTEGIILPTQMVKAETKGPIKLIIMSHPKVGKTSLLAGLKDNLIIDFQRGTETIDALKVYANNIKEIKQIIKAIQDQPKGTYKYITLDPITELEPMCLSYGELLYSQSLDGKNWFKKDENGKLSKHSGKYKYKNILNLPFGAGYRYLKDAFFEIIARFDNVCTEHGAKLIMSGHIDYRTVTNENEEIQIKDLDLYKGIKGYLTQLVSDIGYIYRSKENENTISFKTQENQIIGARAEHLRNQEFVISELQEDGTLKTNWDKIFID